MFDSLVTTLGLYYSLQEPYAQVRFAGDNDPALIFTLIHQSLVPYGKQRDDFEEFEVRVDTFEFSGEESSPKLDVEDKDVLIILAKRHDDIVASQIYEVDFSAVDKGFLLIPRGGFNLLCDQVEQEEPEIEQTQRLTIPVIQAAIQAWVS